MIRRTPFLIAGLLLLPLAADARTIEMTDMDTVMMAAIHEDFPLSSWAGWKSETGLEYGTGEYTAGTHAATLVQFPLDRISAGARSIDKSADGVTQSIAEWSLSCHSSLSYSA